MLGQGRNRRPCDHRETCVELIEPLLRGVALEQRVRPVALAPLRPGGDAFPERAQLGDARFRRISSNQRSIYGANRYTGDPVGMKIGLSQRLIDPGLISTERTTALKQDGKALERRTRPRRQDHAVGWKRKLRAAEERRRLGGPRASAIDGEGTIAGASGGESLRSVSAMGFPDLIVRSLIPIEGPRAMSSRS
jgi:hypothetical protein